jgi:CDGSH-type Zn-finger protein/uncharacterized Fe-S cluster protein YjdI
LDQRPSEACSPNLNSNSWFITNMHPEPALYVPTREALIYQLNEAAEIEHNLMCCYLYAAFSMKTEADGITKAQAVEVASWKRVLIGVAIEEMSHLALVTNLTMAIGGSPHMARPNFPVGAGIHPAGMVLELAGFDRDTLQHFIFLERPEGNGELDGASFESLQSKFQRIMPNQRLMPSGQEFATVGHFYRSLQQSIQKLEEQLGERVLFCGDTALQVGPELVKLPGLSIVTDLASALIAFDTIVLQGEGAAEDNSNGHYRRLVAIREAWDAFDLSFAQPFVPARSVARNPVMRRPPTPERRVFIASDEAGRVVDLANAIYGAMLRLLAQGFAEFDAAKKAVLLDAAIDGMYALVPAAEYATQLAVSSEQPNLMAGMSFATLRDMSVLPVGASSTLRILGERVVEIADACQSVLSLSPAIGAELASSLGMIAKKLGVDSIHSPSTESSIETEQGQTVAIHFEAKRCIHARFCVLQAPEVFKANTPGKWIYPDAMAANALIAVAENCPSGAIQYEVKQHDGSFVSAEIAPPVNTLQVRENGPYSLRSPIELAGESIGYRATLCRCGASANKPFCDGSHVSAGFQASGEPLTKASNALSVRDGPLKVKPQTNGPLEVSGNLEICTGTGRTIDRVTQAVLCRCGGSGSKPFCDGTHAKIGFKSA